MRTLISISGTTDHALLQGQVIATTDELQNVLKALRGKGIQVALFAIIMWVNTPSTCSSISGPKAQRSI
jgi:hypothetical protein